MEAKIKGVLKGIVVSDKMEKSAVIKVETLKTHPVYHKKIRWSKKYMIHDQENKCKVGDIVEIQPSRPYSKHKKYCLKEVIKEAQRD